MIDVLGAFGVSDMYLACLVCVSSVLMYVWCVLEFVFRMICMFLLCDCCLWQVFGEFCVFAMFFMRVCLMCCNVCLVCV